MRGIMKIKELRWKVYDKYTGHRAYCGCEMELKNFQVDHIWPQHIAHHQPSLDPNRPENLNPACAKCNNYKTGMKLEEFRSDLQLQVDRLQKNAQFDRALRFKQVEITESPIIFYFEKVKKEGGEIIGNQESDMIHGLFIWEKTPQGNEFWSDIYQKLGGSDIVKEKPEQETR